MSRNIGDRDARRERRHERREVLRQQPPVKWINVIDGEGGAQQPRVQRHLVRMNQAKDMDRLTAELTDKLNPQWGAVRNLFTPAGGTVVKDVTQLEVWISSFFAAFFLQLLSPFTFFIN